MTRRDGTKVLNPVTGSRVRNQIAHAACDVLPQLLRAA